MTSTLDNTGPALSLSTAVPTPRTPPAPLWSVLAFTFLNSLGSGVVTTGIVFLAKSAYSFGRLENYWLGILQGVTYIVAALCAGRLVRALRRAFPACSPRAVLAGLMLVAGAVCSVPILARWLSGSPTGGAWAVWLLVGVYSPLTGILWPMAESFLSGGRSGGVLRRATGQFNVAWSSALVVAFFAMAFLLETNPLLIILILGGVHVGSTALLLRFPPSPAPHIHEEHEPHPPVYRSLLAVMRLLLPTSYVLYSALNPYLPLAFERMGIPPTYFTVVAAAWLLARTFTMVVFERLHAWHGRWGVPIVGGIILVAGFAMTVLSPRLVAPVADAAGAHPGAGAALAVGVLGLTLFGVGMGAIYCAAIYYAMEVGSAEVDAGGVHEALIGVGYTVGPGVGLALTGAVHYGALDEARFPITVVIATGLIAAPVILLAMARALRQGDAPE
jgi:hypothetical protein